MFQDEKKITGNMKFITLVLSLLLTGCTINVSNVDTHGVASDVIDDVSTTSPDITADISVPVSVTPGV